MEKKIVCLNESIRDWEGKEITEGEKGKETPITLKQCLLRFLRSTVMSVGLTDAEKDFAGIAGSMIGISGDSVTLGQKEYDALKKLVDTNKVSMQTQQGNVEVPLMPSVEVLYAVKAAINGAENVKPEKK